jgi:hypothetical protein
MSISFGAGLLLNALEPNRMSTDERLAELAELLARGLVRLRAKQSSRLSACRESSFVDFDGTQSGHAPATQFAESNV